MTRYNHLIDEKIVDELYKKGTRTASDFYDLLNKSYPGISWTTVLKQHLMRLCDVGIIKKSSVPRPNNEKSYSLTPAAEFQLEYDIFQGVKSKSEDPAKKEETHQNKYRKILTLLLLQAASGSSCWKVMQKIEPGLVGRRNPETGRHEWLESSNEKGVTVLDIVQSRDHSNDGLFSHINFNESDVDRCYDKLVKDDKELSNIIVRYHRDNGETAFGIKDDMLCNLIRCCSSLLSVDRIEDTLKLVILKSYKSLCSTSLKSVRQSRFIHDVFEWYISLFGQKRFNLLYAKTRVLQMKCRLNNEVTFRRLDLRAFCDTHEYGLSNEDKYNRLYDMMVKEEETIIADESSRLRKRKRKEEKKKLKELIQSIEEQIRSGDESILHTYHCRILCDKYEAGYPEKYTDFVGNMSDMSDRYSHLRDIVIDICYPEFLRKEHKHNPELIKYVKSLPAPGGISK
jgi:DNA-binding HxlR family transcriptional regulator